MDKALAEAMQLQKLWQKADVSDARVQMEAELQKSPPSESPSEVEEDVLEEVYLQVQPIIYQKESMNGPWVWVRCKQVAPW